MVDIIDINQARRDRKRPLDSYFVRVDLYEDGIAGAVLGLGDEQTPDEQRTVANHLTTLSRWLSDLAAEIDDNEDEVLLSEVKVFKSGRVWAFCQQDVETQEQLKWMDARLDDAKAAIRP